MAHSEKGETPMMEAKAHSKGFLRKAEKSQGKLKREGKSKSLKLHGKGKY